MSSRWIGSALAVLLATGCESSGLPPVGVGALLLPTWTFQQRLPASSHLTSVRFNSAGIGFVAGDGSTILRTDDGGQTWSLLEHSPRSRGGDIAALDLYGTGILMAAGSDPAGGRWWSTSNGLDFNTPDTASTGFTGFVDVDLVAANVSYALASNGAIRFFNGSAAATLNAGAGTWNAIDFAGLTGVGYVAGAGGTLRKTSDNGQNWGNAVSGTVSALRDLQLLSATTVYACGDAGTVIKTVDGTNWSDVSTGAGVNLHAVHFPVDALTGWAVGDGGRIRATVNGGLSWGIQTAPGVVDNLRDVWFVDNFFGYAVGENGTVLKTVNAGLNWINLSKGSRARLNSVDFTQDGVKGLAVGNGGVILRTLDGGATWAGSPSGVLWDLNGVSVPNAGSGDVAYACGAGGVVLKTLDFGASWGVTVASAQTFRAILFQGSDTTGFCVGDASTILFTSNGGSSWTPQTAPAADYFAVAAPFTGLTAYAAGTGGMVAYTDNAGVLWQSRPIPAATTVRALQAPSGSTAFAGAIDGKVYRTFLSATLWQVTTPGGAPDAISFLGSSGGLAAGSAGIFFTDDGGLNWASSYEHTNWPLRAIWSNSLGIAFAVGDNGTILKSVTNGR